MRDIIAVRCVQPLFKAEPMAEAEAGPSGSIKQEPREAEAGRAPQQPQSRWTTVEDEPAQQVRAAPRRTAPRCDVVEEDVRMPLLRCLLSLPG